MLSPAIFREGDFYPIAVTLVFSIDHGRKIIVLTSHSKLAIFVQAGTKRPIVLSL